MKTYTTFTPSHKILYENYFLQSLPSELELCVVEDENQYCKSASFYETGWSKTCYKKVELFLQACQENMGKTFFYSDVDVQFFGNVAEDLIEELGDCDIACQNDIGNYCSGIIVCKGNNTTLRMFELMKANYEKEDQHTLNNFIHLCNHKALSRKFFTFGHISQRAWSGENFDIPDDILMHHANWVLGVENKMRIIDIVREKYEQRNI